MASSVFSECDIVAKKVMQTVDGNIDLHEGCLCVGYIILFVPRSSGDGTRTGAQFNRQLEAPGGLRTCNLRSKSGTSMAREFHSLMR